jgi:hypothetical protein
MEEFVSSFSQFSADSESTASSSSSQGDREPVIILVIGSRRGINNVIHTQFRFRFAQIHEWSKPMVDPNSGRLMSILTNTFTWVKQS